VRFTGTEDGNKRADTKRCVRAHESRKTSGGKGTLDIMRGASLEWHLRGLRSTTTDVSVQSYPSIVRYAKSTLNS